MLLLVAVAAATIPVRGSETTVTPPAPVARSSAEQQDDIARLTARRPVIPVQGAQAKNLIDSFIQSRDGGARAHEALDIPATRGAPVIAVEDGRIVKLFLSKPGGITLYQLDPSGQYIYFYGHLDRYADGITEGMAVKRGQILGYVGSSGNADPNAPHLHFAIFKLGPEKRWWKGAPINPYPVLRGGASSENPDLNKGN
ncbi:MAG: M23 family metallopeptidase [Candidatus Competibacteraceae bacterium]|nr:M23 family metallopeptidase [Candidatus Competibacteraceae bacterium]